jgi:hypothetical protein
MATVIRTISPGVQEPKETGINVLETLVEKLGDIGVSVFEVVKTYMQLPLSAPTMAAVIAIITNDVLAHKVDFVRWQHQETICLNCTSTQSGIPLDQLPINFLPGAAVIVSLYDAATAGHAGEQLSVQWFPGIISSEANLQIAGVILGSFGISAAGAIISDISQIDKLVGSNNPAPLTTPSVTTLNIPPTTLGKQQVQVK